MSSSARERLQETLAEVLRQETGPATADRIAAQQADQAQRQGLLREALEPEAVAERLRRYVERAAECACMLEMFGSKAAKNCDCLTCAARNLLAPTEPAPGEGA